MLSTLLLFSATGMTINMHFCQGYLYDLAVNVPAHDCCDNKSDDNTCHHNQQHNHDQSKSHHCDNETIKSRSTDNFVVSDFSYNFENSHSFDLFCTNHLLAEIPEAVTSSNNIKFNYNKPLPQEVVLSQIQSFLI